MVPSHPGVLVFRPKPGLCRFHWVIEPQSPATTTLEGWLTAAFRLAFRHTGCGSFTFFVPNVSSRRLHVVSRSPGDFVPNNRIYSQLALAATTSVLEPVDQDEMLTGHVPPVSHLIPRSSAVAAAEEENFRLPDPESTEDKAQWVHFWPHRNPVSTVAWQSPRFFVLVNLRPVSVNHLLVIPRRIVGAGCELLTDDIEEFGFLAALAVRVVDTRRGSAEQWVSLAIQQGVDSGQTVPHLHLHVISVEKDSPLVGEPETERINTSRTLPEMAAEARMFRDIFRSLSSGRPS